MMKKIQVRYLSLKMAKKRQISNILLDCPIKMIERTLEISDLMKFDEILPEHIEEFKGDIVISGVSREPSDTYIGGTKIKINFYSVSKGEEIGRYSVVIKNKYPKNVHSYFEYAGSNTINKIHTGA